MARKRSASPRITPVFEVDHLIHHILKPVWKHLRRPEFFNDGEFWALIDNTSNVLDIEITSEKILLDLHYLIQTVSKMYRPH
jgi:hypothetical protein